MKTHVDERGVVHFDRVETRWLTPAAPSTKQPTRRPAAPTRRPSCFANKYPHYTRLLNLWAGKP